MGEIFSADHLSSRRARNKFIADGEFVVVDELEAAGHLVHSAIMACASIEDLQDRNALVALLAEIYLRVDESAHYLKTLKQGG